MSLLSVFEKAGGTLVEPSVIIDASIPLELSGEAIRARVCTFIDEEGREWALRPDLTLPVALGEIEARQAEDAGGETVRHYRAPVFRLPALSGDPVEYEQVGFERFGAPSDSKSDAALMTMLTEACVQAGVSNGVAQFGDLGIFPAAVDALDLPEDTKAGLKRAFRQEGGVRAFLDGQDRRASHGLAKRMKGMSREEASAFVEDIFALTGINPVGERSSDEIVERLYMRANGGGSGPVPDDVRAILEQVLEIDAPVDEALASLTKIATTAGLAALTQRLEMLSETFDLLGQKCSDAWIDGAHFATRFGRRFTYYDGFVFEIGPDLKAPPFAAGGRYDALLANLSGGNVQTTAIGGIVIPHRLERARGAGK